jgi:hypothetical protein
LGVTKQKACKNPITQIPKKIAKISKIDFTPFFLARVIHPKNLNYDFECRITLRDYIIGLIGLI